MNELFLYNPENDIALACNSRNRFTPPRQAALLARYGAPLMWWMGEDADYVLVPQPSCRGEENAMTQWLGCVEKLRGDAGPRLVTTCAEADITQASPWGWSRHTVCCLRDAGVPDAAMSHIEANIDAVRDLSHRRSAGIINAALSAALSSEWGDSLVAEPAAEFFSVDTVKEYIGANGLSLYLKSPWSSSGRGVVCGSDMTADQFAGRCEAVIRKQGSVLVERAHDKILDFAMLFKVGNGGAVRPYGLSRFFNERGTGYTGNLILSDSRIAAELSGYVPAKLLEDVSGSICRALTSLLDSRYCGYMGVDMMVVRRGDGFALVPCVELNLRMTMGVVAHSIHALTGMEGTMRVCPGKKPTATRGALPLVPENPYFNIEFVIQGQR